MYFMKLVSCGKSISMQHVRHTIVSEEQELKLQNFMWQKLFQIYFHEKVKRTVVSR